MIKVSDGIRRLLAARDPVLHPRRRDHGRGRHGGAAGQPGQGLRRRHPRRPGARQHPRLDIFGCISGSSVADTASIGSVMIPQMIKHGYPRVFAINVTISRLGAAAADPAVAQRGDLFACGRRHDLGRAPVHRRRHSGAAVRACADRAVLTSRTARLPEGRGRCRCARR